MHRIRAAMGHDLQFHHLVGQHLQCPARAAFGGLAGETFMAGAFGAAFALSSNGFEGPVGLGEIS